MRPTRILAFVALATAALLIWQVALGPRSALMGFSWRKQQRFESLQLGTPKTTVVGIFGAPRNVSPTCNLPQRKSFEAAFLRADASGATEFLLWANGGNWYYSVGFDAKGQVVFVGEGCS